MGRWVIIATDREGNTRSITMPSRPTDELLAEITDSWGWSINLRRSQMLGIRQASDLAWKQRRAAEANGELASPAL